MTDETPEPDDDTDAGEIDAGEAAEALEEARHKREVFDALRGITAGEVRHYSVGPALLAAKASATFDAHGITTHGGDPGAVGHLLVAFNRFLASFGADVLMTALHFTNSVTLELEPVVTEAQRRKVEQLAHEHGEEPLRVEDLKSLLPDPVVAIEAAADVLSQPPESVAVRVRALGAGARDELRKLSAELEKQQATLTFVTGRDRRVELSPQRAKRFAAELRTSAPNPSLMLTIVGQLTRTDSEAAEFRVVLDPRVRPPELHGRRKAVEGGYSSQASRQVREGGLWDTRVVAKIRVRMEVPSGGGAPRPAEFTFTDVRPAVG